MTERKQLLTLMNELARNPAARKAYRQNPQTLLTRYNVAGPAQARLLNGDWKGLTDAFNESDQPYVLQLDGFFGPIPRPVFVKTIQGILPRYN